MDNYNFTTTEVEITLFLINEWSLTDEAFFSRTENGELFIYDSNGLKEQIRPELFPTINHSGCVLLSDIIGW
jgi:hypothetical protein